MYTELVWWVGLGEVRQEWWGKQWADVKVKFSQVKVKEEDD